MIKKRQRIPSLLIPQIFQKGKVKENEEVKIYYLKNSLNYCRFAVVISNKATNKSVLRNRIKRQIKSILKQWEKEKEGLKSKFDLIIVVKKFILKDYQSLKEILFSFLESLN
ncbi:MAG: ribonuclease P protein component [Minisyncoccia bacterium]